MIAVSCFVLRIMNQLQQRCVLRCGIKGTSLLQCIGHCGKEIHPICAGLSSNRLRLQEPDEFLVFYCPECRAQDQKRLGESMDVIATNNTASTEFINQTNHKLNTIKQQLTTVVDYIDELVVKHAESGKDFRDLIFNDIVPKISRTVQNTFDQLPIENLVTVDKLKETLNDSMCKMQSKLISTLLDHNTVNVSSKPSPIDHAVTDSVVAASRKSMPSAIPFESSPKVRRAPVMEGISSAKRYNWRWFHISNMPLDTTANSLRRYIMEKFGSSKVICNSLIKKEAPRSKLTFLCFKVGVQPRDSCKCWASDSWPKGVSVRRFFMGRDLT